jgi:hypothetical protein
MLCLTWPAGCGAGASAKAQRLVQALHAGHCGRPRWVAEQPTPLAAVGVMMEWPFKLASFKLQQPGSKRPHLTTSTTM